MSGPAMIGTDAASDAGAEDGTGRPAAELSRGRGVTRRMLALAWSYTEMKIAATVFLLLCLLTLIGPWVVDASAMKMDVTSRFLPPIFMEGGRLPHFLGTDQLGRD